MGPKHVEGGLGGLVGSADGERGVEGGAGLVGVVGDEVDGGVAHRVVDFAAQDGVEDATGGADGERLVRGVFGNGGGAVVYHEDADGIAVVPHRACGAGVGVGYYGLAYAGGELDGVRAGGLRVIVGIA